MNIQIFGTKKCSDTRKAERFFKERGIKYQFIDMKEKGMSKGEFNSVAQANGGLDNMVNWDGKDKDLLALIKYIAADDKLEHQWLEIVSNQPWVICRMFGKTGIRGQEYGKKNYAGSIVSRSEIYRCNGGRPTGDYRSA